jgi:hypothetical protein
VSAGWVIGLLLGLALAVFLISVATVAANELLGGTARAALCLCLVAGVFGRAWWQRHQERRAAGELRRWELTAGWEPAAAPWPWHELVRWPDSVQVLRAYTKGVEGFPVRTGEHLRGDIPPWTVIGNELFLFVPLERPLRPRDLEGAADQAIRVVRLLHLPVEVGEDG